MRYALLAERERTRYIVMSRPKSQSLSPSIALGYVPPPPPPKLPPPLKFANIAPELALPKMGLDDEHWIAPYFEIVPLSPPPPSLLDTALVFLTALTVDYNRGTPYLVQLAFFFLYHLLVLLGEAVCEAPTPKFIHYAFRQKSTVPSWPLEWNDSDSDTSTSSICASTESGIGVNFHHWRQHFSFHRPSPESLSSSWESIEDWVITSAIPAAAAANKRGEAYRRRHCEAEEVARHFSIHGTEVPSWKSMAVAFAWWVIGEHPECTS